MLNARVMEIEAKSLDFQENTWFKDICLTAACRRSRCREDKMVCDVCNGKGYVIEKGRELPCAECQGQGECLFLDNFRLPPLESHEGREAR